jgi:hypothetical protein
MHLLDNTMTESGNHVILVDKEYIRDVERLFQVGLSFYLNTQQLAGAPGAAFRHAAKKSANAQPVHRLEL